MLSCLEEKHKRSNEFFVISSLIKNFPLCIGQSKWCADILVHVYSFHRLKVPLVPCSVFPNYILGLRARRALVLIYSDKVGVIDCFVQLVKFKKARVLFNTRLFFLRIGYPVLHNRSSHECIILFPKAMNFVRMIVISK